MQEVLKTFFGGIECTWTFNRVSLEKKSKILIPKIPCNVFLAIIFRKKNVFQESVHSHSIRELKSIFFSLSFHEEPVFLSLICLKPQEEPSRSINLSIYLFSDSQYYPLLEETRNFWWSLNGPRRGRPKDDFLGLF